MNQSTYVICRNAALILLYTVAKSKAIKAKQAALAMECTKAKRGKAAAKKAATLMGFTGSSSPSSLQGNTPNIEPTSLHTGNYANDYGANINPITGSVNYANDYNAPINPNYTDNPTNYRDTSWHGQESLDKVNDAYQDFKNQYKNGKIPFNSLTYDSIKDFADDHNMTDAERLYFTERIAHDNPEFYSNTKLAYIGTFPELKTQTYCDRYASYVTKIYTGNSDLEAAGHWGVPYANQYFQDNSYNTYNVSHGQDMQEMANFGKLTYASDSGHIIVISPGNGKWSEDIYTIGEEDMQVYLPAIAQQGRDNYLNGLGGNYNLRNAYKPIQIPNIIYYNK